MARCEAEVGFQLSLDTNIVNMTAESLNFGLMKFVEEVYKEDGERYPPTSNLYVLGNARALSVKKASKLGIIQYITSDVYIKIVAILDTAIIALFAHSPRTSL